MSLAFYKQVARHARDVPIAFEGRVACDVIDEHEIFTEILEKLSRFFKAHRSNTRALNCLFATTRQRNQFDQSRDHQWSRSEPASRLHQN